MEYFPANSIAKRIASKKKKQAKSKMGVQVSGSKRSNTCNREGKGVGLDGRGD